MQIAKTADTEKNRGCDRSRGCPFGEQCFIYGYIKTGSEESFNIFKNQFMDEFNGLNIPDMPEIEELYPLEGECANLARPMPNGYEMKILDDNAFYLATQVHNDFNDGEYIRCFGLGAGLDFLLVSEYGESCKDQEIVVFRKR